MDPWIHALFEQLLRACFRIFASACLCFSPIPIKNIELVHISSQQLIDCQAFVSKDTHLLLLLFLWMRKYTTAKRNVT